MTRYEWKRMNRTDKEHEISVARHIAKSENWMKVASIWDALGHAERGQLAMAHVIRPKSIN